MPIMTEAGFVEDEWTREAAVRGMRLALPLEQFLTDGPPADAEAIGVEAPNDADLEAIAPHFDQLALIALTFPNFADGRAFSQARRLRAMGYAGVLRATGKIVADQYAYALACGFDEIEVDDAIAARQPEAQWLAMRGSQSLGYQRGYSAGAPQGRNILEARSAAAHAAKIAAE